MARSGAAIVLAALAACYEPPAGSSCAVRCVEGATNACPDGETCAAGFCVEPGGTCTTALASISVGGRHVCGLDPTGRAACWGDNHQGQIGVPAVIGVAPSPTYVGDQTWTEIAAGNEHTCAISSTDGTIWC